MIHDLRWSVSVLYQLLSSSLLRLGEFPDNLCNYYEFSQQCWPSTLNRVNVLCKATTLKMNPKLSTNTITGSTFNPGLSSVYSFSMVLLLPPAPAARVLDGRWFAILSALSAAAFRLSTVRAPPGGEAARAVVEPYAGEPVGEDAGGEDYEFVGQLESIEDRAHWDSWEWEEPDLQPLV